MMVTMMRIMIMDVSMRTKRIVTNMERMMLKLIVIRMLMVIMMNLKRKMLYE